MHNQIQIDELHSEDIFMITKIALVFWNSPETFSIDYCKCVRGIPKYMCYLEIIKWTNILGQENKQD